MATEDPAFAVGTSRLTRSILLPLMLVGVPVAAGPWLAADPPARPSLTILDVPFVPQDEALCGGAAAAMVERYWGRDSVRAEDFADLIDAGQAGITVEALAGRIRRDGFEVVAFGGNPEEVIGQLARGRPLVALIERGAGPRHYVVLLAWTGAHVLLHDPADAPFRVVTSAAFQDAWAKTGRLTLLILPLRSGSTPSATPAETGASVCDALVERAVALARSGDLDAAERRLLAAREIFPAAARPARELAGIEFRRESWADAARLAAEAAELDAGDAFTWRLLATSRFMDGDTTGALRAWNTLSEPRLDLVRVDGLDRTPFGVVTRRLAMAVDEPITPGLLARAERRLGDLPALSRTRVRLHPLRAGRAQLDVAVLERPLLPSPIPLVAGSLADVLVDRRVRLEIANPTRRGELVLMEARFWENRPAAGVRLELPVGGLGVLGVEGLWDRQTYSAFPQEGEAVAVERETRRRGSVSVGDWLLPSVRAVAGAAIDGWEGSGARFSVFTALEARSRGGRAGVRGSAASWTRTEDQGGFSTFSVAAALRSRVEPAARFVSLRAGAYAATSRAPLGLWPGAGTGHARPLLLRAHPLLEDGVITGEVFGRELVHGSLEATVASWSLGPARLGAAGFADAAKGGHGRAGDGRVPWHLDIGGGLRLALPGRDEALRLDFGFGVNGGFAVSAGWQAGFLD